MNMNPPKDRIETAVDKAPFGLELLGQASDNLNKLHDIENTLFLLAERLLGADPQTPADTDRLNPCLEGQGSFAANLTDYHLRQRDSLLSIERIAVRLQEFI